PAQLTRQYRRGEPGIDEIGKARGRHGLDQEFVEARIRRLAAGFTAAVPGKRDQENPFAAGTGAQLPRDLETVVLRQPYIDDGGVRLHLCRYRHAFQPVRGREGPET